MTAGSNAKKTLTELVAASVPDLVVADDTHAPLSSPARLLQERIVADFAPVADQIDDSWPPIARAAVAVAASAVLWAIMIAGAVQNIA